MADVAADARTQRPPGEGPETGEGSRTPRLAEAAIGAVRLVARVIPAGVKRRVDDGVFHYIFQKTRVENDAYGWRPDTPGGGSPPPEYAQLKPGRPHAKPVR